MSQANTSSQTASSGDETDFSVEVDYTDRRFYQFGDIVNHRLDAAVFQHHGRQRPVYLFRTAKQASLPIQHLFHDRVGDVDKGDARGNLDDRQMISIAHRDHLGGQIVEKPRRFNRKGSRFRFRQTFHQFWQPGRIVPTSVIFYVVVV